MSGEKIPEREACPIAGPASLTITRLSWRGPLARGDRQMTLPPAGFTVVNTAQAACTIERTTIDRLRRDPGGTTAHAALSLVPEAAPIQLAQGDSLGLCLAGTVPARPGTYATTARILVNNAASLTVPVTIAVPASPLWGMLCMAIGLALLGTVNLLAGEGTVRTRLRDAVKARQDIATVLVQTPAPDSRAADVLNMNHDFEAAIASLSARRGFSAADDRDAEARPHLEAAKKRAESLRTDLVGRPQGASEIENLRQDWASLVPILKTLIEAAPKTTDPVPPAGRDEFLARYRAQLLGAPAAVEIDRMTTEFNQLTLEEVAGQGSVAAERALTDRDLVRRSADQLNQSMDGYQAAQADIAWLESATRVLRARLEQNNLPPDTRQTLISLLDQQEAQWKGAPWLTNWRQAHHLIDQALIVQARSDAAAYKAKVDDTIAAVTQQTGWDDIDTAVAQAQAAPKPHTVAMKQTVLTHVVNLWRAHVAKMDEAPAREKLEHRLDDIQAAVSAGKLMESAAIYRSLTEDWAAWNTHLVQREVDKLDRPHCFDGVDTTLADSGAVSSAETCLKPPVLVKPRRLTVESMTPPDDRIVGRRLRFAIDGIDPAWGAAVSLRVAFGDPSPPLVASAETLRTAPPITHIYTAPIIANVTVTATENPYPGAVTGTPIGAGRATIDIAPIPGSQIFADEFVNMRFALALVIALTLAYWRYHSKTAVFGARGYDYVEAFALGFAADAATSNVPDVLKQLYGS